jgi:hypothetical protein
MSIPHSEHSQRVKGSMPVVSITAPQPLHIASDIRTYPVVEKYQ